MSLIKIINKKATEYQYSIYQNGWILKIINDFNEYYTARVLIKGYSHTNNVIAVKKNRL